MSRRIVAIAFLFMTLGCRTHHNLRNHTLKTAGTLTDLNYRQVLDNLARFVENPGAMPTMAVINAGTVTVADSVEVDSSATYTPTVTFAQQIGSGLPILSLLFGPTASRELTENWSLEPVTNVDNLRRIRCAYQMLVLGGGDYNACVPCRALLERFYLGEQDNLECVIPYGWYQVGCKRDVPKDALYVGHQGDVYVWVMPEQLDGLTVFTMTIIDLATGRPHAPTRAVVRTYKADGTLDSTQVTTTEIDTEALEDMRKGKTMPERVREYVDPPLVNPGMFFVPR